MALQTLIVAALVSVCFVYAIWHLMPGAAKRPLAHVLSSGVAIKKIADILEP